jgi:hypothetical protein
MRSWASTLLGYDSKMSNVRSAITADLPEFLERWAGKE